MAGKITWFPGHMHKALKAMHKQLKAVDMVIEVRDARVPWSAANPEFDALLGNKRKHLVFNKVDLIPTCARMELKQQFKDTEHCTLICTKEKRSVQKLLESCRFRLSKESNAVSHLLMVLGLPNTGKSSLINAFRQVSYKPVRSNPSSQFRTGSKSKTGPNPGVTRQVSSFKISTSPSLYIIDTPGVMLPSIQNYEMALRLGLTSAFKDNIIGESELVRYLLGQLVRKQRKINMASLPPTTLTNAVWRIVQDLDESDLVQEQGRGGHVARSHLTVSHDMLDALLDHLGLGNAPTVSQREAAFRKVLDSYRQGALGLVALDDEL